MCLEIMAFCLPPVAVCWRKGCCSASFCLSILLTLFGWLPGCCFACYVINQEKKGGGNVTQVTTIQMAAPPVVSPPQPQHIVVNVNERQGQSGGYGYPYPMPMPTPCEGAYSPPYPMAQNPYPTPVQSPPPPYNNATAPMYAGGDYIPPK